LESRTMSIKIASVWPDIFRNGDGLPTHSDAL
jgi:hypothetical protein